MGGFLQLSEGYFCVPYSLSDIVRTPPVAFMLIQFPHDPQMFSYKKFIYYVTYLLLEEIIND